MRRILTLLALVIAAHAYAEGDRPAGLQPLPAVPPPPPEIVPFDDALQQPEVTIRKRDADTIEEYRMNGKLYMLKVTPAHGVPYVLIDTQGDGNFTRLDTDQRVRVPQWIIKTF